MLEIAGLELLPHWPLFGGFIIAGLALNFVPGADMTFIIAAAARGGRKDGIVAALGIGAGTLVHICAAVLGLSALLASSESAFNIVKWIGAAYLLFLAISMVRPGAKKASPESAQASKSGWPLLRAAMLVNVLNPKVALFFLAFLPQFVDPRAEFPALQILCLGLWFDLVGTIVNIGIASVSAATATRLRQISWIGTASRWFAATVLGALALKLALAERT